MTFAGETYACHLWHPTTQPPVGSVSLVGQVSDPTGKPVSGVRVEARGVVSVATDVRGEFRLVKVAAVPRLAVSFSAPGFVRTTRVFQTVAAGQVMNVNVIVIWPRATAMTVDAVAGGRVPFANGGSVTLPPNALVDNQGRPLTGSAQVSVTYLDVSDRAQRNAVPGDFTAKLRNGSEQRLESFGVFEIFVADGSGQRAELARGKTADVQIPIPRAFGDRAPERTRSFSFDPYYGYWHEEGMLVRNELIYSGKINQFDWSWNADDPLENTCMTFQVMSPNSTMPSTIPEPNCLVEATGVNYGSVSTGYTDNQGLVCLLVKRNEPVSVKAISTNSVNYQSIPVILQSPNFSASASDCGDQEKCPRTTIFLDIITHNP
ncbi:MAG TPA: carboxypeptidase-like regulatory domain-containing protein [Thermoanaerobaculia bacterium]|nr:carboxypeptidase-like regulatory domain-containing protein [Thermoanaerobaculia bacterium]